MALLSSLPLLEGCSGKPPAPPKSVYHLFEDAELTAANGLITDTPDGQTPPSRLTYPHGDAIWSVDWHGKRALRFESAVLGQLRGSLHFFHQPAPAREFELRLSTWLDLEMEEAWSGVVFWMPNNIHNAAGVRWKASGRLNQLTVQIFHYHTPELAPLAEKTFPLASGGWTGVTVNAGPGSVAAQVGGFERFGAAMPDAYYHGDHFGLYQGEGTGWFADIQAQSGETAFNLDELVSNWNGEMLNTARVVLDRHFAKPAFAADRPVPYRRVSLAGEWRLVLPAVCPSELVYTIDVPPDGVLRGGFGILPPFALSNAKATVRVAAEAEGFAAELYMRTFQPAAEGVDWFRFHDFEAPLGAFAGKTARLKFTVESVEGNEPLVVCWSEPVLSSRSAPRRPNVLLYLVDTLRADRLGVYGNENGLSPAMDAFAREGTVFANVIAQAPWTLPSHASFFTGLYPNETGCANASNQGNVLQEGYVTLAEMMREMGYHTAAFTGAVQVRGEIGFHQGFDLYQDIDYNMSYSLEASHERFVRWMDARRDEPWFAFLHTYAVHNPYNHEQFKNYRMIPRSWDDWRRVHRDTYDGGVKFVDEWFARMVDELRARKLYDSTLIILTSDHGEDLGERWMPRPAHHGHALYDEQLRVPLVLRLPEAVPGGERIENQVRLLDILPTAMEALGGETPPWIRGKSLFPLLRGEEEMERLALSEGLTYGVPRVSLHGSGYKWIHVTEPGKQLDPTPSRIPVPEPPVYQLFDLSEDPGETVNLAETLPEKNQEFVRLYELMKAEFYDPADFAGGAAPREAPEPSADLVEQLRTLGYLE